jgi:cell division protein FtsX
MPTERIIIRALIAVAFIGLALGFAFWMVGNTDLAAKLWTAGTLPVVAALLVSMTREVLAGRLGVDAIAFVSMSAGLLLGQQLAAVVVAVMYAGGNMLEDLAMVRAERDLKSLVGRAPRTARRLRAGQIEEVLIDRLSIGDTILVRAGETSDLIHKLGWPLSITMALGALAGALNTMYSSVAARAVEIATLRAIGFGGTPAFIGTLVESLILSLLGGIIGTITTNLVFDGVSASTLGASFTQVVFRFSLSPALIGQAMLLALIVGLVGGLLPAARAARMPIVAGLSSR